jgi:THO complex subunit 4
LINSELKVYLNNYSQQNIFSRVGQLKRCGIHWDELGNSKGTADVEFLNPIDAKRAIEEFNSKILITTQMRKLMDFL